MLMRLVRLQYRLERLVDYCHLYEETFVPELEQISGCLYAGLLQNIHRENEGWSITLWNSRDEVKAYIESGVFDRLVETSRPYLADSGEWTLRLTEDAQLEYAPVSEEPSVFSYEVAHHAASFPSARSQTSSIYMRMVTMRVHPDREQEFSKIYEREIHPLLLKTRGCRHVYMVENLDHPHEWVCVTIWEQKENADRYEDEGGFRRIRERLAPTLSGLFQWKVGVDRQLGKQAVTSEDLAVAGYRVIVGKAIG